METKENQQQVENKKLNRQLAQEGADGRAKWGSKAVLKQKHKVWDYMLELTIT